MVIERGDGQRTAVRKTNDELVLQCLDPLQHGLSPRGWREEGISRLHRFNLEPKRLCKCSGAQHPSLSKFFNLGRRAEADDLTHPKSPSALERSESVAFMSPANTF